MFLLNLSAQVDSNESESLSTINWEIFLAYWVLDICFAEVVEFYDIKKTKCLSLYQTVLEYAAGPWNVYDIISLSTAVAAAVTRGMVHSRASDVSAAASNQVYAWALALLWGRLANVLLVISFIGPLIIMVFVMLFKDLTKFVFLVVMLELPFVAALHFLERSNEDFATFPQSALSFFKIVIGQGPDITSVTTSLSSPILLAVGTVLLTVLLLNLLIAMFSKTFDTRLPPPLSLAMALRIGDGGYARVVVLQRVVLNGGH
jgi:hypothetical protein